MSKYDRSNLQTPVYPENPDVFGNIYPFLGFLDTSYNRSTRELNLGKRHVVQSDEEGRLDLISYRNYGVVNLWWIIGIYNGIIIPTEEVLAGSILEIPTMASIESYFKEVYKSKDTLIRLP